MDWAVLYLRLFTGASMLFHNIGKIQNYNEIISSYPSPLYINPPAVFVIVTVAEALLAVRDYWFNQVGGSWLACCHASANPASGRVMQKAGWVYDHDAVYHKFNGAPVACRVYYQKNPNEP